MGWGSGGRRGRRRRRDERVREGENGERTGAGPAETTATGPRDGDVRCEEWAAGHAAVDSLGVGEAVNATYCATAHGGGRG